MASLTKQALVISSARLLNQGLMVISPLILVRLLTVDDFGLYREFLLYASVVGNLAAFSFPNSLLYFVGREPGSAWVFVNRIVLGVGVTSLIAVFAFAALSALLPEPLVEGRLVLCAAYVLFYTNVDFWEFLWFSQKRPVAVFAYTSGRLAARLLVVVSAAWLTGDIDIILWALLLMEGCRLAISLYFWNRMRQENKSPPPNSGWREMLEFCVPSGLAVFVTTLSSSLSGIFVDQALGTVALAQFVIGGYVFMSIFPLRNALSDVLLPEMAAKGDAVANGWLPIWRRSVVIVAVTLMPVAVGLARYSEEFIGFVFSEKYLGAKPVFLAYCVLIALSCFDLAVVYRAINRTRAMLAATVVTVSVNLLSLVFLVPRLGMHGAAIALVAAHVVALAFAVVQVSRLISVPVSAFLPFRELGKILLAAVIASGALIANSGPGNASAVQVVVSVGVFFAVYALALKWLKLEEFSWFLRVLGARLPLRRGR